MNNRCQKSLVLAKVFAFAFITSISTHLAWAALPTPLANALAKDGVAENTVSIAVQQVDSAQALVLHQAEIAMNPASVMKVLTTYAGLEILGPAYRWTTEVYATAPIKNGVLEGDLVLQGHGDPALNSAKLWQMLNSLRSLGLREIKGNLLIDNSYFSPQYTDAAAFDGDVLRAYNATPDAMLVNLKSTSFRFGVDGGVFNVRAEPDLAEISIQNKLKTSNEECGDWRRKMSYQVIPASDTTKNVTVVFSGSFPLSCNEKYLELSLLSNEKLTYGLFKKTWQELGGTLDGEVRLAKTPEQAIKLMEQSSAPYADIVRDINKYSNNLMAKHVLLTIAAEKSGIPATESAGAKAIRNWLATKGLDFPELVIENGAGLSRQERISSQHLNQLLLAAFHSPVMSEFMSSLPILGVDGTTNRRLKESAMQGRAHLKTGSIDNVRSIAGYVLDAKGRYWTIVFLANGTKADATRSAQDALIEWVYNQP